MALATTGALAFGACASPGGGKIALGPEPVPYADTLPIPEPRAREAREIPRLVNGAVNGEVARVFRIRSWVGDRREALNVTHLDDVVGSAWFQHRNGRRRLTPREIERGPTTTTGPDTSGVLTIVAGKAQGISPGFTVRDARGHRYVFKFDPKGFLHLGSAAGVISNRLFWAAGYNVPEDYVVEFDPRRIEVGPEARITTSDGHERPMGPEDVRALLARVDTLPNGRFLAVASRFVPGVPKGPFYFRGRRADDPNDHYHHEYRRDLRGLYVVSAWLNHVDMRFANTLDAFVAQGYLRHYLIDFAATLGSGTIRPHSPREGMEYNFDFWPTAARIFTAGFFRMGWEDRPFEVIHPSIGWLPAVSFDPATWKANWPNEAFRAVTPRDGYWGAKLVGSFTDEQIEAAVAAGKLPSAFAADTLAKILAWRRDRTVAYWYGLVTPIEQVRVDAASGEIRFDDLGIRDGAWSAADVRYAWSLERPDGTRIAGGETAATGGVRQRLALPRLEAQAEGSAGGEGASLVLRVRAVRSDAAGRAAVIALLRGPDGRLEVRGLVH